MVNAPISATRRRAGAVVAVAERVTRAPQMQRAGQGEARAKAVRATKLAVVAEWPTYAGAPLPPAAPVRVYCVAPRRTIVAILCPADRADTV